MLALIIALGAQVGAADESPLLLTHAVSATIYSQTL